MVHPHAKVYDKHLIMVHSCVWCNVGLYYNGFSHIRNDVSSKLAIKQEGRTHCWLHMVGLTKVLQN